MTDKPIIALDFPSEEKVFQFLSQFQESLFVKVGLELYLQEGPSIIKKIKAQGHEVFLDLKLHDIPNTVKSAMRGLAKLGVDVVNVHAAGGSEMMKAALEGLQEGTPVGGKRPALIAVTQLTSTSEEQMHREQKITTTLEESVLNYAKLAKESGLDGVVCSVLEAKAIEKVCGKEFLKVTPGIRLSGGALHDQKRVATPSFAKENGSTHIVVGRAITQANDVVEAYHIVQSTWGGQ
ncbi:MULTISPECIES: orotidine-5'-phosphate decarboxylase [unclassified Rummeliibacillus]|uniref:orotidine-5'-phosphate decarboxylase n=1 Tax=unclassified Rummeliibacillus TaxID=2622809 RepID=UPI000E65F986|nr:MULTISPECIES: orotidine-5'-phosphate decarboxylase [unclassified Rummeliibacillus]RIJ69188.1 orotidine-5'-phosphate decarboxylase [Rummeliibacillus sp. POC4]RPJ96921.1 orotidine-5'-phosphate decarboxylase [Rummeliibacillus sp. TYF005]